MRILFFLCIAVAFLHSTFGQHKESSSKALIKRHEVKMNVFNLLVFQASDITYEYLINENTSFGSAIYFRLYRGELQEKSFFFFEVDNNRSFSLSPYFRRYFTKGYASGFFVEGFGMLSSGKTVEIEYMSLTPGSYDYVDITEVRIFDNYTDFAFGLSIGGKHTFKKGFIIEYYTGIGLNIGAAFSNTVSRGGFSMGYRF